MNELALFAGAGGGILGGKLLGWRTICAVEIDAYDAGILVQRQNDGILAPFPIWDDVRTFVGKPWRGIVDVVSGGFPCQDISCAGNGAGISGERSGLWTEFARIVGEVQPSYVYVENSPMLTVRGIGDVLGDLAALGYDAQWGIVSAANAGAPHRRERIWIVADTYGRRCEIERKPEYGEFQSSSRDQFNGCGLPGRRERPARTDWWKFEPNLGRMVNGMANRVDRLRCLGNGQVPAVAALAWRLLTK